MQNGLARVVLGHREHKSPNQACHRVRRSCHVILHHLCLQDQTKKIECLNDKECIQVDFGDKISPRRQKLHQTLATTKENRASRCELRKWCPFSWNPLERREAMCNSHNHFCSQEHMMCAKHNLNSFFNAITELWLSLPHRTSILVDGFAGLKPTNNLAVNREWFCSISDAHGG